MPVSPLYLDDLYHPNLDDPVSYLKVDVLYNLNLSN